MSWMIYGPLIWFNFRWLVLAPTVNQLRPNHQKMHQKLVFCVYLLCRVFCSFLWGVSLIWSTFGHLTGLLSDPYGCFESPCGWNFIPPFNIPPNPRGVFSGVGVYKIWRVIDVQNPWYKATRVRSCLFGLFRDKGVIHEKVMRSLDAVGYSAIGGPEPLEPGEIKFRGNSGNNLRCGPRVKTHKPNYQKCLDNSAKNVVYCFFFAEGQKFKNLIAALCCGTIQANDCGRGFSI